MKDHKTEAALSIFLLLTFAFPYRHFPPNTEVLFLLIFAVFYYYPALPVALSYEGYFTSDLTNLSGFAILSVAKNYA